MSSFLKVLFFCGLLLPTSTSAQVYDTITLPHRYAHHCEISLIDGRVFSGPLIDANDSSLFISAFEKKDSVIEFQSYEIDMIKLFRSDFERSATNKLILFGAGGISFFTTLNILRNRKEELNFKNSEWLISGIASLVAMPLAAVISNAIYTSPREFYQIEASPENFHKHFLELKAYSLWTYLIGVKRI